MALGHMAECRPAFISTLKVCIALWETGLDARIAALGNSRQNRFCDSSCTPRVRRSLGP